MFITRFRVKKKKTGYEFNSEKLFLAAQQDPKSVYTHFNTSRKGLNEEEVEDRLKEFGDNEIAKERRDKWFIMLIKAFINPFIGILMFLALISLTLDVLMAEPQDREWITVIIITSMVAASAILRFVQELKSNKASDALKDMVNNTATVYREESKEPQEIDIEKLVPGDVVMLAAGDMIPADVRIIESKDLFVSQSTLTGESDAIEKYSVLQDTVQDKKPKIGSVTELDNICFMGTNVVSGSAKAIIVTTGQSTYLGTNAQNLVGERAMTSFDKGINSVSLLLIRFMVVMVPFVFLINGLTKGDWFSAFIFAVSVAVGLTPEMLPMIVTSNLAKGATVMAKRKTIVKNLNAIQSFGAMNILCTDKTGTLTKDKIVLEKYLNVQGEDDKRVLRHAYLNSFFQTGLKNLIDKAILSHNNDYGFKEIEGDYIKVDEIPFDFTRRRMSVIIESKKDAKRQIITKGAFEEMLEICSYVELNGKAIPITDELRKEVFEQAEYLNKRGMRVLGVAQKSWIEKEEAFDIDDEIEMVLIGYLAFLDPPKPSTAKAIQTLREHGVEVKVLSGDNDIVTTTICRQVGIDTKHILLGVEVEEMTDEELEEKAKTTNIFAKLTPMQKVRIITAPQQDENNTIGFLGDGVNDAAALRQADIGISVDTAVDISKESADIILLEKDLMVLEQGVREGRKIFGNIMKYIKMTASSNFGNMFSVLAASSFLPFLPMLPVHLLVQNLLYDISQTTIPFDNVDEEYIVKPRKWDASDLKRFMLYVGPISSIFDIATFLVMWYIFKWATVEHQSLFQSGWFILGLLSQTLIVHMIRTRKIPFIQSRASISVILTTFSIMAIGIIIPFTVLGESLGFVPLPLSYFPWLIGILLSYCILTQLVKAWYIKKFARWL
jgi:Mg2+-importing ATPase